LGTNHRKGQVVVCAVSEKISTLHYSLHYLTDILLPLLVGWRHAADPRFAKENQLQEDSNSGDLLKMTESAMV
jgi:hypothetical protein